MKYIIKDFKKRVALMFVLSVHAEQRNESEFKHFVDLYLGWESTYTKLISLSYRTGPSNTCKGFHTYLGNFAEDSMKVKELEL